MPASLSAKLTPQQNLIFAPLTSELLGRLVSLSRACTPKPRQ